MSVLLHVFSSIYNLPSLNIFVFLLSTFLFNVEPHALYCLRRIYLFFGLLGHLYLIISSSSLIILVLYMHYHLCHFAHYSLLPLISFFFFFCLFLYPILFECLIIYLSLDVYQINLLSKILKFSACPTFLTSQQSSLINLNHLGRISSLITYGPSQIGASFPFSLQTPVT